MDSMKPIHFRRGRMKNRALCCESEQERKILIHLSHKCVSFCHSTPEYLLGSHQQAAEGTLAWLQASTFPVNDRATHSSSSQTPNLYFLFRRTTEQPIGAGSSHSSMGPPPRLKDKDSFQVEQLLRHMRAFSVPPRPQDLFTLQRGAARKRRRCVLKESSGWVSGWGSSMCECVYLPGHVCLGGGSGGELDHSSTY